MKTTQIISIAGILTSIGAATSCDGVPDKTVDTAINHAYLERLLPASVEAHARHISTHPAQREKLVQCAESVARAEKDLVAKLKQIRDQFDMTDEEERTEPLAILRVELDKHVQWHEILGIEIKHRASLLGGESANEEFLYASILRLLQLLGECKEARERTSTLIIKKFMTEPQPAPATAPEAE